MADEEIQQQVSTDEADDITAAIAGAVEAETAEAQPPEAPEVPAEAASAEEPSAGQSPVEPVAETQVAAVEPVGAEHEAPVAPPKPRSEWWPYVIYAAANTALAGAYVAIMLAVPEVAAGRATFAIAAELLALLLAFGGPLIGLLAWRRHRGDETHPNSGTRAFARASVTMFIGLLAWGIALVVVDFVSLGKPF